MKEKNKFLIVIDTSYFLYWTTFSAVTSFQKKYPNEASLWIKPIDECDQSNLPNLLNCDMFKRVLKNTVMNKIEMIDAIVKQNFQNEVDIADKIDIVCAMDDRVRYSFRMQLYPQYKANRRILKRQYQVQPIKDYIVDVIFKELDVEEKYGYHLVKVEGAEGDDVVATALLKLKDNYIGTMLIASDHDFLQIEGVREFDMYGKEAKRDLGGEEVSAEDYLLGKILMGDKSDNIKQVFYKCGPKTALKLVKDKDVLKTMLKENQESASRYALNKKIISFDEIPSELTEKIFKSLNESLYSNDILNEKPIDFKSFMEW